MKRGLVILILFCAAALAAAAKDNPAIPCQVYFNVVTQDRLKNVSQGLSAENAEWFQKKIEKKYPGACYAKPAQLAPIAFFITITPDTYHGTRIVDNTSSHTSESPVTGTIRDEDGNVSHVDGTVETTTTTTSSTAVPYSFEYGIFTLTVERQRSDGKFDTLQTFQQKGIYHTLYGIPLGGKGHHPVHAVIEDAAKWVNGGGLTDQRQSSIQPTNLASIPIMYGGATLQSRAQAGDARAQFAFGLTYEYGDGVPHDPAQAAQWYRKAAEQGLAAAQFQLGVLYESGKGVPQDYIQADDWYRKAAEQGDADAQFALGCEYELGFELPKDYAQAAQWFSKAAEQGHAGAQNNLGLLYYRGLGLAQNYVEAYFWLNLAVAESKGTLEEGTTKTRDEIASHLMPEELSQAQARASKWFESHQSQSK